jgi:hypothetical protein
LAEAFAGLLGFGTGAKGLEGEHAVEGVDSLLFLAEGDKGLGRAQVGAGGPGGETFVAQVNALVVGLSLGEVCSEDALLHRFFTAAKVTDGLDNMAALEEDLTALQYHLYSELWPKEEDGDRSIDEIFLVLLIDFLALMVTIDGAVDDREILEAESKAIELFGNFDRESVRERCRAPEQIPSLDKMVSFANKLLTDTGIENLKTVLRRIAAADGVVQEAEARLLDVLEASLQSEPPKAE